MGYQKFVKLQHKFIWDFAGAAGSSSSTATGTIPIFSAPAKCLILSAGAEVMTAITGSTAEELGDGTDPDGFLVDGFAATAGFYPLYVTDASGTFAGAFTFDQNAGATDALDVNTVPKAKLYSSADTIDFKITGTATAGKVAFIVEFMVVE
jgi:hypothetical protein